MLGAGGLVGQAFHVGVLCALAESQSWSPEHATLIVGTSAGSGVGAFMRLGLTPRDLLDRYHGRTLSESGASVVARFGEAGDWTRPTLRRAWRPPHPRLLGRIARTPWRVRPEALLGVSFPTGRVDTEGWTAALRAATGHEWPRLDLWICAVRMDDAHRVVFGRDDAPTTDVATAVGASSAIPGYFAPVVVHGRRYVDGGVHSPTNADVVRDEDLDLVVVSSPMSISRSAGIGPPSWAPRRHFQARLGQEVRRLRRAGRTVATFQPSAEDLRVMGRNAMDTDRLARVAEQARITTLRRVEERGLRIPHRA